MQKVTAHTAMMLARIVRARDNLARLERQASEVGYEVERSTSENWSLSDAESTIRDYQVRLEEMTKDRDLLLKQRNDAERKVDELRADVSQSVFNKFCENLETYHGLPPEIMVKEQKIATIKNVRSAIPGLGLKAAKGIVDCCWPK